MLYLKALFQHPGSLNKWNQSIIHIARIKPKTKYAPLNITTLISPNALNVFC